MSENNEQQRQVVLTIADEAVTDLLTRLANNETLLRQTIDVLTEICFTVNCVTTRIKLRRLIKEIKKALE